MTAEPPASWHIPPEHLRLDKNQVHVWRVALDQPATILQTLSRTLSPDETERAAKFFFQRDRDHFVVARGVLRTILGGYLKVAPARLRFVYDEYGKPALSEIPGESSLSFNLSHSHGLALYGLTLEGKIGIDIEHVREDFDFDRIAEQFFAPREVEMLRALPLNMRREGFFNCWTRKEAYIKAIGHGLSLPLDEFVVSLAPGEPAALLSITDTAQEAFRWSIKDLIPEPGYVAAVVVEGQDWQLAFWQWDTGQV